MFLRILSLLEIAASSVTIDIVAITIISYSNKTKNQHKYNE